MDKRAKELMGNGRGELLPRDEEIQKKSRQRRLLVNLEAYNLGRKMAPQGYFDARCLGLRHYSTKS